MNAIDGMPHVTEELRARERMLASAEREKRDAATRAAEAQLQAEFQATLDRARSACARAKPAYARRAEAVKALVGPLAALWEAEQAILLAEGEAAGLIDRVVPSIGAVGYSQAQRLFHELRAQAGLPPAHESLGLPTPGTDASHLAVVVGTAVALGYIVPTCLRVPQVGFVLTPAP